MSNDAQEKMNDEMASGDNPDDSKPPLSNPEALAAAQNAFYCSPTSYISMLPKVVKRRLKALKKLQVESNELEAQFFEELHKFEIEYEKKYKPLLDKRSDIINAKVEPTDQDCEWPDDADDPLSDKFNELKVNENGEKELPENLKLNEDAKGIPEFWLTIFKNVELLRGMLQPHDLPILAHLQDIKVQLEPEGFNLQFIFSENEFFTNQILNKSYSLRFKPEKDEALLYEGPEIYKCKGTKIDWKKDKNVTIKVVKKVKKHKNRGTKKTFDTVVRNDSFFNFFDPPEEEDTKEIDEETEALLETDFEIGHFIRERVIPKAVLYYTGDIVDDDDDEEDYGEMEDDDEDEEDDDDDEN